MRQNEFHHLWEIIKPIASDPVTQKKMWELLLTIVENERRLYNQATNKQNKP